MALDWKKNRKKKRKGANNQVRKKQKKRKKKKEEEKEVLGLAQVMCAASLGLGTGSPSPLCILHSTDLNHGACWLSLWCNMHSFLSDFTVMAIKELEDDHLVRLVCLLVALLGCQAQLAVLR